MATANYVLLGKTVIGAAGNVSAVTFDNIPQTGYTDLVVKSSARTTYAVSAYRYQSMWFNGVSTGAQYLWRDLYSDPTTKGSQTSDTIGGYQATALSGSNVFSNTEFYFNKFTATGYKAWSAESVVQTASGAGSLISDIEAGTRVNTAATTSITFTATSGYFAQYTTFYLYGIAQASVTPTKAPKATGGEIIQNDGTYWYHAFLASGTFTPALGLTCDVLQIAGGGGGGGMASASSCGAGGGGAGGLLYYSSQSVSTAQTVTVGSGGAGGAAGSNNGTIGNNAVFASLTASVGGGRGGTNGGTGGLGGSGGGGGQGQAGGAATSGQGFAGGTSTSLGASGGGGAGAVGGSSNDNLGRVGGAGINTYSSWLSTTGLGVSGYIAGGGAGASSLYGNNIPFAGGAGGGGNSGYYVPNPYAIADPTAGIANTGSGGGGAGGTQMAGANGGAGLVIIRYPIV